MSYRSIDTERKLRLILENLKGAKICSLARKYEVDEDSIHLWKNKVLKALPQILSPKTPGPRPRSKVEILKGKLKKLQKKYEALSQISQITVSTKTPSLLEERPSKYPECGATRIWKNETYQVKGERTSRSLKWYRYLLFSPTFTFLFQFLSYLPIFYPLFSKKGEFSNHLNIFI